MSIFKHPCRPIGKGQHRFLTDEELHIAKTYILVNCRIRMLSSVSFLFNLYVYAFYNYISYVINYRIVRQFKDSLKERNPNISEDEILIARDRDFSRWLKQQVSSLSHTLYNVQFNIY